MWWYSIGIHAYRGLSFLASWLGHKKAKARIEAIQTQLELPKAAIWIHVASAGEFEQAIPIIEAIQKETSEPIVLSVFSPSAFSQIEKSGIQVQGIYMFDFDTSVNRCKAFIEKHNIKFFIHIKYEFWWNWITALHALNVPYAWVSVYYKNAPWFTKFKKCRTLLQNARFIWVQDQTTIQSLESIQHTNLIIGSDTRIRRVIQNAQQTFDTPDLGTKIVCVAGSTWQADEAYLCNELKNLPSNFIFILFPHEAYSNTFENAGIATQHYSWSEFLKLNVEEISTQVFIIHTKGILKYVYRMGQFAYLGGGFGKGIHNIWEAAVYRIPVVCGPKTERFREAELLHKSGQLCILDNTLTKFPFPFEVEYGNCIASENAIIQSAIQYTIKQVI